MIKALPRNGPRFLIWCATYGIVVGRILMLYPWRAPWFSGNANFSGALFSTTIAMIAGSFGIRWIVLTKTESFVSAMWGLVAGLLLAGVPEFLAAFLELPYRGAVAAAALLGMLQFFPVPGGVNTNVRSV